PVSFPPGGKIKRADEGQTPGSPGEHGSHPTPPRSPSSYPARPRAQLRGPPPESMAHGVAHRIEPDQWHIDPVRGARRRGMDGVRVMPWYSASKTRYDVINVGGGGGGNCADL